MRFMVKAVLLLMAFRVQADTVYVANFYAGSIQKFITNGTGTAFAFSVNSPEQMICDSAGNLYLANYGDSTVLKFSTDGVRSAFCSTVGGANGLAFDKGGNLYVANFDGGTIDKFSPTGTSLGTFASGLVHPIGLIFDTASNLYVSTYGNNIEKFSSTGTYLGPFAGGLNGPIGMAFDREGNLYVANFNGNTVTKFSSTGALLGDFASGLSEPYFIGFDAASNLYVANFGTNTVLRFTPAGVGSIYGTISSPCSLAVWPGLSLVVTNGATNAPPFGLKMSPIASGQMTLRFFGNTNSTFTVLASTNMLIPKTNWTVLGTATLQASNMFQFTDTHATNRAKFYVVRSP